MKNPNMQIVSIHMSKDALEKIDRIAYITDRSRSMVVDSVLKTLSDYTITRCVKRCVREKGNTNHEKSDC